MHIRNLTLAGAAFAFAAPALAQSDNDRFAPIQPNDALYTCQQLEQEATVMEQEIGAQPGGFANLATADAAIGIGTDLAVRAAGEGAARALGALGGLGGLARNAMRENEEAAERRKEMAQDRWYYLAGLYMGKSCLTPAVAAVPPAPVPAAPVPADPALMVAPAAPVAADPALAAGPAPVQ